MRTAVTPIELLMAFDMKLAVMRDELDYMQRKVQAALSQIRGREEIAQLNFHIILLSPSNPSSSFV